MSERRAARRADAWVDGRRGDGLTLDSLIFLLCCSKRIAVPCDSRRHFSKSPSITVRRTAWRKEQPRRRRSLRPRRRLRRSRPPSGRRRLARNNATALRSIRLRRFRGLRRSTDGTKGSRTATLRVPTDYDEEGVGETEASFPGAGQTAGAVSEQRCFAQPRIVIGDRRDAGLLLGFLADALAWLASAMRVQLFKQPLRNLRWDSRPFTPLAAFFSFHFAPQSFILLSFVLCCRTDGSFSAFAASSAVCANPGAAGLSVRKAAARAVERCLVVFSPSPYI